MDFIQNISLVGIKLTYKCNLKCYMCGQRKMEKKDDLLSVEHICRVIDSLKQSGAHFGVYLWGGEPFLYRDLFELIHYIKSRNIQVTINTNGTFLYQYAHELVESRVNRVIVSIDGLDEIHDEIRGVSGTFDKVMKGVQLLNSIKKLRPFVTANIVVSSKNYYCMYKIVKKLIEYGISYIEIQLPMFFTRDIGGVYQKRMKDDLNTDAHTWEGFIGSYHEIDISVFLAEIKKIKEEMPQNVRIIPDIGDEQIETYFSEPASVFKSELCKVPFQQIRIEPNGDVVVCPDFPDYAVGNIIKTDILEIFNGERICRFRENLTEKGLLPVCGKCILLYEA